MDVHVVRALMNRAFRDSAGKADKAPVVSGLGYERSAGIPDAELRITR
jgi:hypothetical protein